MWQRGGPSGGAVVAAAWSEENNRAEEANIELTLITATERSQVLKQRCDIWKH